MKNNFFISTLLLSSSLLFASEIPKLPEKELYGIINKNKNAVVFNENDIDEIKKIYNIKDENTNFKPKDSIKDIKKNSFKLTNDFSKEKSKFTLKNLLSELEIIQSNRDRSLNREYQSIYLAKDDMSLYLSNKEYSSIKSAFSIEEALQLMNQYTGLNLSLKAENTDNKFAKIFNIGVWNHYDINNTKKFITLEPKNTPTYLYGSTKEDKAFFYFKNYNKQYNKDVYFDLNSQQILDLYEKLLSWGVDKEYYNTILAGQFFKNTSSIKNFNYEKAYTDLLKNPSLSLIKELKESINNSSSNYKTTKIVHIQNNQNLYSIIEDFNLGGNILSYINSENLDLKNLEIQLSLNNPTISISKAEKLEDYFFVDKKTKKVAKLKVISNSYLHNSPKDFIVHAQKDIKQQTIHYLDMALKNAKEIKEQDFSYKLFEDDIKTIKKDLL